MQDVRGTAEAILHYYYRSHRAAGHTHAALHGVLDDERGARYVTPTHHMAEGLNVPRDRRCSLRDLELRKLSGATHPLVFDHTAIEALLEGLLHELAAAEASLAAEQG